MPVERTEKRRDATRTESLKPEIRPPPAAGPVEQILALQRAAGNQAVGRLLTGRSGSCRRDTAGCDAGRSGRACRVRVPGVWRMPPARMNGAISAELGC